jgi:hypothetical protein
MLEPEIGVEIVVVVVLRMTAWLAPLSIVRVFVPRSSQGKLLTPLSLNVMFPMVRVESRVTTESWPMSLVKFAELLAPLATVEALHWLEALQLFGPAPVPVQVPVWAEAGRQGAMKTMARVAEERLRKRLANDDFMVVGVCRIWWNARRENGFSFQG